MNESIAGIPINIGFVGLAVICSALILLIVMLSLFAIIMKTIKNSSQVETKFAPAGSAFGASQGDIDDEVVAVISAAVYAMYDGSEKRVSVHSIKPVNTGMRSPWAAAGVARNTKAF